MARAAWRELQTIVIPYQKEGWSEAVGSSGTAKAIVDLLEVNGFAGQGITREGLIFLRNALYRAGNVDKLDINGVRADRLPVLTGGLAIMSAVFKELGVEQMTFSEGALRLGVLYDLLGRYHHEDLRAATVNRFMQRYEVDKRQAGRVTQSAQRFLYQLVPDTHQGNDIDTQFMLWAARLHEIGVSIAHASYHKHSAYILANADMPGFSRRDQTRLARLVLAHRGKLERVQPLNNQAPDWTLIFEDRIWMIELKTERGSHRANQLPHYLDLASHHYPGRSIDVTYLTGPLTKPAPALRERQRYVHLT